MPMLLIGIREMYTLQGIGNVREIQFRGKVNRMIDKDPTQPTAGKGREDTCGVEIVGRMHSRCHKTGAIREMGAKKRKKHKMDN